jgi:hypothetical protein
MKRKQKISKVFMAAIIYIVVFWDITRPYGVITYSATI